MITHQPMKADTCSLYESQPYCTHQLSLHQNISDLSDGSIQECLRVQTPFYLNHTCCFRFFFILNLKVAHQRLKKCLSGIPFGKRAPGHASSLIYFHDWKRSDANMFPPQPQTKACAAGHETAIRYQIQRQAVPEPSVLYPALKIPPRPAKKHTQVLTSCQARGAKPQKYVSAVSGIFLSFIL